MCYPVCGMVHIKETLLLIRRSNLCSGSNVLSASLNKNREVSSLFLEEKGII